MQLTGRIRGNRRFSARPQFLPYRLCRQDGLCGENGLIFIYLFILNIFFGV